MESGSVLLAKASPFFSPADCSGGKCPHAKVYFYGPVTNVLMLYGISLLIWITCFGFHLLMRTVRSSDQRSVDLSHLSASGNDAWRMALYTRVLSVISNRISIGVKHLEFLAFSSSQLRDNSAWIFGSRTGFTASDIRKSMGDFRNIRNVANRYKLMSCVYDLQLLCAIVSLQELCCL